MVDTTSQSCLKVCIADDDSDLRTLLTRFVETLGHRVVCTVEDGRSLLDVSGQYEIDLMLVDFDMPVLDGLAAAEELSSTTQIPIIMMSGHPDLKYAVPEQEPIAAWLCKPITLEQLQAAIQSTMAHS
jgi:DNA-binding response OmpR family regulator